MERLIRWKMTTSKLSKEQLEKEKYAIEEVIKIHETGITLNQEGAMVNKFLLELIEEEIAKFK